MADDPYTDQLRVISGADIRPEPVDWLWPGWLAAGKLHILAGAPGAGKTTIALALAATTTSAGRWPDGTAAAPTPGSVLIWSGEDDPKDTLIPRLLACGADTSLVHFVDGVDGDEGSRPFDPAHDARLLGEAIDGVDLVIVDPVVSAVAGDSHKNAETRRALQPLCDLARNHGCAVLGISHFTKGTQGRNPLDRLTGSLAFGAVARIVMAAAKLPDDDEHQGGRIFARVKSNLGPDDGGFKYDLRQTELSGHGIEATQLLWGQAVDGDARELLADTDDAAGDEQRTATTEAADFLRELLRDGPVDAKDGTKQATAMGFSKQAIYRARQRLGIRTRKAHFSGGWRWHWPQGNGQDSVDSNIYMLETSKSSEPSEPYIPGEDRDD